MPVLSRSGHVAKERRLRRMAREAESHFQNALLLFGIQRPGRMARAQRGAGLRPSVGLKGNDPGVFGQSVLHTIRRVKGPSTVAGCQLPFPEPESG